MSLLLTTLSLDRPDSSVRSIHQWEFCLAKCCKFFTISVRFYCLLCIIAIMLQRIVEAKSQTSSTMFLFSAGIWKSQTLGYSIFFIWSDIHGQYDCLPVCDSRPRSLDKNNENNHDILSVNLHEADRQGGHEHKKSDLVSDRLNPNHYSLSKKPPWEMWLEVIKR